jgi:hypothetical protein
MTREELIQELERIDSDFSMSHRQLAEYILSREQELRDKLLSDKFTYCAYCGQEFNIGGEEAKAEVGKHIHNCEKHPISEYKAKIAELQELQKLLLEKIGNPLMEFKANTIADYEKTYGCDPLEWGICDGEKAIDEALAIIEKEGEL